MNTTTKPTFLKYLRDDGQYIDPLSTIPNRDSLFNTVAIIFSTGLTRTTNTITNNLSTGINDGQSVIGGINANENLTLQSTINDTKGRILFGTDSYFDETLPLLSIGESNPDNVNAILYVKANLSATKEAGINILMQGTSAGDSYGITINEDLNATTGNNYGVYIVSNISGASKNIGGFFSSSGASKNYALIAYGGLTGIGTDTPLVKCDVRAEYAKRNNYSYADLFQIGSSDTVTPLKLSFGIKTNANPVSRYAGIDVSDAGDPRGLVLQSTGGEVSIGTTPYGNGPFSITSYTDDVIMSYICPNGGGTEIYGSYLDMTGNTAITNYGIKIDTSSAVTTNIGLYINAANATNNYGLLIENGKVGIGTTSPTAILHLKAGTATVNTAPLKFTSGTLLDRLELGTIEFIDDSTTGTLYITLNVAGVLTRKKFSLT